MIRLRSALVALALVSAMSAPAAPFTVFADGETFTYRVSWAVFPGAGRIVISAHDDTFRGVSVVRIDVDTSTRGLVRFFYSYEDRAEAIVERATSRILQASDKGGGGGKNMSDTTTTFDYAAHRVAHVDRARPGRDRTFDLPEGDPIDLISCLVDTRSWNVKPGDRRPALVYFDDDIYPITIIAEDYEDVSTGLGTFKALRLVPVMEKDPKGVFARGGSIKVWVSQGQPRLPVQMQLQLKLGTATLHLIKYSPGTAPAK